MPYIHKNRTRVSEQSMNRQDGNYNAIPSDLSDQVPDSFWDLMTYGDAELEHRGIKAIAANSWQTSLLNGEIPKVDQFGIPKKYSFIGEFISDLQPILEKPIILRKER